MSDTLDFYNGILMRRSDKEKLQQQEAQAEYDRYENMTEEEYEGNSIQQRGSVGE